MILIANALLWWHRRRWLARRWWGILRGRVLSPALAKIARGDGE